MHSAVPWPSGQGQLLRHFMAKITRFQTVRLLWWHYQPGLHQTSTVPGQTYPDKYQAPPRHSSRLLVITSSPVTPSPTTEVGVIPPATHRSWQCVVASCSEQPLSSVGNISKKTGSTSDYLTRLWLGSVPQACNASGQHQTQHSQAGQHRSLADLNSCFVSQAKD